MSKLLTQPAAWQSNVGTINPTSSHGRAIQQANLDWDVIKVPAFANYNGELLPIPGGYSTVRTDTGQALGTVGKDYTVIQNRDAFAFFDEAFKDQNIVYEHAGVLDPTGCTIWALAKLPSSTIINVPGKPKDDIGQYLMMISNHTGQKSLRVMLTPVRAWCTNMLLLAISSATMAVRISHTASSELKLKIASDVISTAAQNYSHLGPLFESMARTPMTDPEFKRYVQVVLPTAALKDDDKETWDKQPSTKIVQMRSELQKVYEEDETLQPWRGTAWGAYNAFTCWVDHVKAYRNHNVRLNSIMFSSGASRKTDALHAALAFANMTDLPNHPILPSERGRLLMAGCEILGSVKMS